MQKRKILVVEDNKINRDMLYEVLHEQYSVILAENGQQGLNCLKENEDVDLILLDIIMPVMDGYTFLDIIKNDNVLSLIPVIVITQGNSQEDEVKALKHGANDFISKPYNNDVILHRVKSIITLRETAALVNNLRYDRLTNLYKIDYFFQKVKNRLAENPDKHYCIVCSNIENFKLYNDVYGVEQGDKLLKELANIMIEMVGKNGICGRYSADRFVCLQEANQEKKDKERFGKINFSLSSSINKVVMRWGVYYINDTSISIEQMCSRALLAVNSIKGSYNQFFAIYDDALREKLLSEKAITDCMESSLKENQFEVYLQPKYDINDNIMIGAEALVRWNHPQHGLIPPNVFMPIFEKSGFISRLDKYVWEQVCIYLSNFKEKNYPYLPISINVSRIDIYEPDIIEYLANLIKKYDIDPSFVHLEITESAYAESQEQMIMTMNNLRNIGFEIEMDDFGSGYSSLSMIGEMKLDTLKLDTNFVHAETAKPIEHSILNDVINMAHRLNLKVIAEGVETKEQIRRLQTVGCDYVQGFFFARPMKIKDYEELLLSQKDKPIRINKKVFTNETSKYTILLADDDAKFSKKICDLFNESYNIISLSDACQVIEKIKEQGEAIAIIILSMTLANDGAVKIMKYLRSESGCWEIPVLATTPNSLKIEKNQLALEADDFLCKLHPLFDLRKKVQHLIDEALTHRKIKTLINEAHHDYMTNLLNRRGFNAAMEAIRNEHKPLALCLFDLDNLKKVNDTYGHDIGDRIISAFTEMIRHSVRSDDIICRYGGDEFIILFKNICAEDALKRARQICFKCQESIEICDISLSCSCGIAICSADEVPTLNLIEQADKALYEVKRSKKGNCVIYQK